jgi:hypothetical protein
MTNSTSGFTIAGYRLGNMKLGACLSEKNKLELRKVGKLCGKTYCRNNRHEPSSLPNAYNYLVEFSMQSNKTARSA